MNSLEIRNRFLDYYQKLGFSALPGASMLHPSIPMSFVMSAGLVQVESALSQTQLQAGDEVVLVQRCFRHFDIDRVGTDNTHLTLFEMPGAFVLDGHNKQEVISRMWTLATCVLGLEPGSLWVSYFAGGQVQGHQQPKDEETYQAWRANGVSAARLVGLDAAHNYWLQGGSIKDAEDTTRSAGPNTEIFFDRGQHLACNAQCLPGCGCGRFVEFANSLFIVDEYNTQSRAFSPMEAPFYETVIGTERVAMIRQRAASVFDTDRFAPLIRLVKQYAACSKTSPDTIETHARVIADHSRALGALVAEGAPPPGKNGRERIIKLLIRGLAARQMILEIEADDFVQVLADRTAATFEDEVRIRQHAGELQHYYAAEVGRFHNTVARGRHKLAAFLSKNRGQTLSGTQILTLEKQWGFPPILTAMELDKRGLAFRSSDYKAALHAWRYI